MNILSYLQLKQIQKDQWLPRVELEKIQSLKLQKMVQYAYENVQYYHDLFDSVGVKPEDIQTKDDLSVLPITTRAVLQETAPEQLISSKIDQRDLKEITTSGSSGSPLTVFLRQKEFDRNNLVWARASQANGHRLFGKTAYLKYSPPPTFWFEKLGIWKKDIISIRDPIEVKISKLRKIQPDIIKGTPYELITIARSILEKGVEDISPKSVFSMGSLLDEHSRALLKRVFHADVYDFYGATEIGLIAWECSAHNGYHINMDATVVEIIHKGRRASANETGRVVCTNLNSHSMPFIRYDLGDFATMALENCPCGRELPLLKSIEGKADDFFMDSRGELHSPSAITNRIKMISGIRDFRLIQTETTKIKAQLVVSGEHQIGAISRQIQSVFKEIMGECVEVYCEQLPELPKDPEKKIRAMISYVAKEF